MSGRRGRYDGTDFREAYLLGTARFKSDIARFEDELTDELQRNMIFSLWQRAPDDAKEMLKNSNPEAYAWIKEKADKMKEDSNG